MKYIRLSTIIIFVGSYIFASSLDEKNRKKKKFLGIVLIILGCILKFLNY
ncbi:hypothetical protein HMPREF3229_00677 [Peptoniphilus harei]|uniref:Uncharacterized protein n=1 Tax=Peptoniphilus harei TaxID=54005 RepID=A0A133PR21_9FIRM|nr:hypothetical protein [Peptoniphilus harei]KXA31077.1 hypothetical protein HMPREF3229_00677 [Peptoniphilus harei]MDU6031802.1 hypothetical protein [Peptoniphilus harei]